MLKLIFSRVFTNSVQTHKKGFCSRETIFDQIIRNRIRRYGNKHSKEARRNSSYWWQSGYTKWPQNKWPILGGILGIITSGGVYYIFRNVGSSRDDQIPATSYLGIRKEESSNVNAAHRHPDTPPTHVPYLIVGAGTAAFAAFRAIRSNDPTAKVLVIGDEPHFPYMRPPLSKELWFDDDKNTPKSLSFKQWNGKERSLYLEHDDFYCAPAELERRDDGGVAVLRGRRVTKLDTFTCKVHLDSGSEISYDRLLIATGGRPRTLPLFENAPLPLQEKISFYRSIEDYRKMDQMLPKVSSVVVIGGGFLGSELACAFGRRGRKMGFEVVQIFPESGNMGSILPAYLSKWTTEKVKVEGVKVLTDVNIVGALLTNKNRIMLKLSDGEEVEADHVIVAAGLKPNTDLALCAGLEVDKKFGGIVVNAEMEAASNVWVAGDVACFFDPQLGRRRIEHHDHAVVSGRLAGQNMTGAKMTYCHQSMFWSDLGPDVGYEAIGIIDSTLPTIGVFAKATEKDTPKGVVQATGDSIRSETEGKAEPTAPTTSLPRPPQRGEEYGKGIVFYMKDDLIVGIVMWNVFNRMPIARRVLKEGKKFDDLNEVAKLFNIHDSDE